jgi:hypothetical protein
MTKIPQQKPEVASNEEGSLPDWISIARLIYQNKPIDIPVLAEAIDKHRVQTFDDTGRRILATDGDESDYLSKTCAKKHLSIRHNLTIDPIPDDDLEAFHDRLAICGDPLDKFGWPKDCLPDFTKINPHVAQNIKNSTPWTQRPFDAFEKELKEVKTLTAAAKIHGVSRQRYTDEYKKKEREYNWARR